MPLTSVNSLVDLIRKNRLLEPAQLEELINQLRLQFTDPRALAHELLKRDWLTPYQANQLLQGSGQELVLGPYEILARIGDGAMGQVFKARHRRMDRLVALKVIRPELLARPDAVQRFYQETQAASMLSHPHIVHAYDAGPIGQTHFFAMEYVEGTDLETLVAKSGALPIGLACMFIRQAAQGMQHAFERGMAHHDIKPANLLIARSSAGTTSTGTSSGFKRLTSDSSGSAGGPAIKIRNLGLTLLQPLPDSAPTRPTARITGTPDYLAPERAQSGGPGDIRSDIYSLGCTFYFTLTGRVPFPGGTAMEKLRRHLTEEPTPLASLRPDCPAAVVSIVGKMMAKKPEQRFQVPAEVSAVLGNLNVG